MNPAAGAPSWTDTKLGHKAEAISAAWLMVTDRVSGLTYPI